MILVGIINNNTHGNDFFNSDFNNKSRNLNNTKEDYVSPRN